MRVRPPKPTREEGLSELLPASVGLVLCATKGTKTFSGTHHGFVYSRRPGKREEQGKCYGRQRCDHLVFLVPPGLPVRPCWPGWESTLSKVPRGNSDGLIVAGGREEVPRREGTVTGIQSSRVLGPEVEQI